VFVAELCACEALRASLKGGKSPPAPQASCAEAVQHAEGDTPQTGRMRALSRSSMACSDLRHHMDKTEIKLNVSEHIMQCSSKLTMLVYQLFDKCT
jgi:hypothetical protein